MEYNSDGSLVTKVTDARGNGTTYSYGGNPGLVTKVTDAKGNETSYTYDSNTDAVTSVSSGSTANSYTYEDDQLTKITHNGFDYSFTYDGFGNTTQTKVGSQTLMANTYGPYNGLLQLGTYGNGKTVGYTYDEFDQLIEKSYDGTAAFRYKYDARGALFEQEDLLNNITTRYEYDLINRLTGVRTSHGQELLVRYDDKNRVDFNLSKVLGVATKTQFLYGDTSQQQKPGLIYGVKVNGNQVLSYGYDGLSRLSTRTLNTSTPFVTRYEYLEGSAPNSTTALIKSVQNGDKTLYYSYDELGNITEIRDNLFPNLYPLVRYEYDELGQLVKAYEYDRGMWAYGYTYDDGGNILKKSVYDLTVDDEGTIVDHEIVYGYNDANWKDKLTSYNGQTITYDEIGNPLTYRDGMAFTWQHGRELATFSKAGTNAAYHYNDSGIRVKKVVNGVETEYYLNGSTILTQITGDDRLDFLYDDTGSLLGFLSDGESYYYVKNLQGDITGILDSNGSQVVNYVYDAWGKVELVSGTMSSTLGHLNPFRYRGYYYDEESSLYYLNSRYYDPETCRFINADGYVDTAQGIHSQNMFAYCANNPINRSDLNGQFWGLVIGITFVVGLVASLSGCSSQPAPTSNTGAAQPYVNMPGSSDKNSPNCYAYAIGSPVNEQPGGRSGKSPTKWNDVNDVGKSVEADLKSMGKTVRKIDGPNAKVYDNEFKIALRVGTQPYAYNPYSGELYYDYHFMRQTDTGQWAEKHGIGGASVLWDAGMTPDTIPWTLNGVPYYDSPIIYYAVGN
ncbi:RHS repeat-associated core domain-containing protein [Solibaculum intestinale]|uniref:RHS repeat-associated core domain-containing protein n=1 Tax=Solibaculum intestinale TaxID=3133165 RepID=A0ABV1E108_9FIRM